MQTRRITFYLGEAGLPSWLIKGIHQQVKAFDGDVTLIKVQSLQSVNIQDYFNIMQLAFQPFELCQLVLRGNCASPTFTSQVHKLNLFLQNECLVLNASTSIQEHSQDNTSAQAQDNKPSKMGLFHTQLFHIDKALTNFLKLYSLVKQSEDDTGAEKQFCLRWIAKFAQTTDPIQLEQQLNQREQLSSTGMKGGIALPHIISDTVTTPQLIILTQHNHIDWLSSFGPVTHVIALLIPKPPSADALLAVRHLVTTLIKPEVCEFICQHDNQLELQAILTCFMQLSE